MLQSPFPIVILGRLEAALDQRADGLVQDLKDEMKKPASARRNHRLMKIRIQFSECMKVCRGLHLVRILLKSANRPLGFLLANVAAEESSTMRISGNSSAEVQPA